MEQDYDVVIGLEVHARLLTKTKLFSGEPNAFGGEPNTLVSPLTLGHPGTLPFFNELVLEKALMLGLACESKISEHFYFERKNYFYPDLPKGYQISQLKTPICGGGFVQIETSAGEKKIQLNRIHIEEDAGKSFHDAHDGFSLIDLNRAGTPLLEIVTEPVIFSADEAYHFILELRRLVRFLDVCDGNMEEGSLRCDANISLKKKGTKKLGTKIEVKNLNSARFLRKAIEYEIQRQARELDSGHIITQHTRGFDAEKDVTFVMREKEEADDYRYFPEPDLPPLLVNEVMIARARKQIPQLPAALRKKFSEQYGVGKNEAAILADDKLTADYFEKLSTESDDPRIAANWMLGAVKNYLNEKKCSLNEFPIQPEKLAELLKLVKENVLNNSAAAAVFSEMGTGSKENAREIAKRLNLLQTSDEEVIKNYIDDIINENPEEVRSFKNGKKVLLGFLMGELMKRSKTIDPKIAKNLLTEVLNKKN